MEGDFVVILNIILIMFVLALVAVESADDDRGPRK